VLARELGVQTLVRGLEVAGDGHAVVGFEDLAGGEPGVGRVLVGELALVVVVTDEVAEVDGGAQLAHLEVWVRGEVLGLQK
jgi:hypothetical protein